MKTFKEFLFEEENRLNLDSEYLFKRKGRYVIDTKHSSERIIDRNQLTEKELKLLFIRMIENMLSKGKTHTERDGQYLFFSKSLRQGIVVDYRKDNKSKNDIRNFILITYLPRGTDKPKPGTKKVVLESHNDDKNVFVTEDFVSYLDEILPAGLSESVVEEGDVNINVKDFEGNDFNLNFYFVESKVWDILNLELIEVE